MSLLACVRVTGGDAWLWFGLVVWWGIVGGVCSARRTATE